jgi:acyl-CoA thioester hydrolase
MRRTRSCQRCVPRSAERSSARASVTRPFQSLEQPRLVPGRRVGSDGSVAKSKSENQMTDDIVLEDFPARTSDKVRYRDTDRQGHVNNAVFATFLETGRVEILFDPGYPLADPGSAFVIARLVLDFRSEVTWPGEVTIGTRVASIGRSSVRLEQAIFQNGKCVATAETAVVQMDETTRRSRSLSQPARDRLSAFIGPSRQSEA